MGSTKMVDLAVVGAGITGLSTALHAKKAGLKDLALIDPGRPEGTQSRLPLAMICSAPLENVTRLTHTWGDGLSKRYLRFAREAYHATKAFLHEHGIDGTEHPLNRLLLTDHEAVEADAAVKILRRYGYDAKIEKELSALGLQSGVGVQQNGDVYTMLEATQVVARLDAMLADHRHVTQVDSFRHGDDGYVLGLADGSTLRANVVVFANHLAIPQCLGSLQDAFVSTCEQAILFTSPDNNVVHPGGLLLNYAHETNISLGAGQFYASGARFLRHHAGVGLAHASDDPKVTAFLEARVKEVWGVKALRKTGTWYGFDCRPCDELPIIGPMFGERGVLLASGYMNQGLSFGFFAGRLLADLIVSGKSDALPREFMPERLRSLRTGD